VRAWRHTPLDAPTLLISAAAVLSIGLAALAGSTPVGWHGATLWRSFLSPLVVLSAISVEAPGERGTDVKRRALAVVAVWAGAAVLPSVLAWFQFETGVDLLREWGLRHRVIRPYAPGSPGKFAAIGFFGWYTLLAQNLTCPLALVGGLVFHARLSPRARALFGAAAVLIASAVALTLSRIAWVALAAAAAAIAALGGRARARVAVPAVAAAFLAMAAAQPALRNRLVSALAPSMNEDRMQIWGVCAAVIRDYPLTGIGWGNLHPRVSAYYDRLAPWALTRAGCHNVFYTLWAEGSLLLFSAGVLYWVLLARAFWRWLRTAPGPLERGAAAGALAALLALFLNGLFHDVFYSSEPMYALGFALGVGAVLAAPAQRAS
jgi:O-antigen ligase